jgi:hypothetical protein
MTSSEGCTCHKGDGLLVDKVGVLLAGQWIELDQFEKELLLARQILIGE